MVHLLPLKTPLQLKAGPVLLKRQETGCSFKEKGLQGIIRSSEVLGFGRETITPVRTCGKILDPFTR